MPYERERVAMAYTEAEMESLGLIASWKKHMCLFSPKGANYSHTALRVGKKGNWEKTFSYTA